MSKKYVISIWTVAFGVVAVPKLTRVHEKSKTRLCFLAVRYGYDYAITAFY